MVNDTSNGSSDTPFMTIPYRLIPGDRAGRGRLVPAGRCLNMTGIQPVQIWECSTGGKRWVRVVVSKIEGDLVTLRYEGVFEFATVPLSEMEDLQRFRPAIRRG